MKVNIYDYEKKWANFVDFLEVQARRTNPDLSTMLDSDNQKPKLHFLR